MATNIPEPMETDSARWGKNRCCGGQIPMETDCPPVCNSRIVPMVPDGPPVPRPDPLVPRPDPRTPRPTSLNLNGGKKQTAFVPPMRRQAPQQQPQQEQPQQEQHVQQAQDQDVHGPVMMGVVLPDITISVPDKTGRIVEQVLKPLPVGRDVARIGK